MLLPVWSLRHAIIFIAILLSGQNPAQIENSLFLCLIVFIYRFHLLLFILASIILDFCFQSKVEETFNNSCAISIKRACISARAEGYEKERSKKTRRKIINYCLLSFLEARRAGSSHSLLPIICRDPRELFPQRDWRSEWIVLSRENAPWHKETRIYHWGQTRYCDM